MDINNLASYMTLEPSQLMRAERCVEQGLGMFNRDEELTENYIKENLAGSTLEYAMHLLDETTTTYMGVQIHNQNGKFSAPTAGVYNSSSRPELKAKIKDKVLKRNERENKTEEVELEEASMKQARKNVGADTCWKGYKAKGTKTKNGRSVPNCVKEEDIDEAVAGQDREMRKAAAAERSKEKSDKGGAASKIPGREGPSVGKSYADYQKLSIKSHDKLTKKNKNVVGLVSKEEVEEVDEATYPSDFKKGSPVATKKTGRPNAQGPENGKKDINEEDADRLRDRRMERGGVDGNTRYNKAPGKPNTFGKKPSSGMSAFDKVVADLKSKHGDKSIISKKTIKKESIEELDEKKMSKDAHKKAAKAGKRWQDSDGDGKWYEPGEDVKKEETAQLKGKKKGNVIINPEVSKVNENQDPDASKKMQIQRKQLMINKQKVALQQKATSKKQSADMHTEENLQEVDVTTRANNFGAEIENTTLKRKKEKKSLKTFKQLSKGE